MWAAILPVAGAVGVFGAIYGAAAQPVLGAPLTLLSSVVIFSGAAQFSMVGLLAAGTSPVAVLGAVAVLSLRHLVLGAAIRPAMRGGPARRALAAWFVLDETVGLALAEPADAARTYVRAGWAFAAAWLAGTAWAWPAAPRWAWRRWRPRSSRSSSSAWPRSWPGPAA